MKTQFNLAVRAFLVCAALLLSLPSNALAAARTASVSGNWTSTATWGGSSVPVAVDTVTNNTGVTLTINTNGAECASVQIGTGNGVATLNYASTGSPKLTVSGSVLVGNAGNANRDGTITFASGSTLICGSISIGNNGNQVGTVNMTAGGTLKAGSIAVNSTGSIWTPGAGSVELTSTGTLPSTIVTSFNNLTVSGGTTTLGVNLSVTGSVIVTNGAGLDLNSFNINRATAGGAFTVASGSSLNVGGALNFPTNYTTVSLDASSTVIYDNAGAQRVSPQTYGNLVYAGSGAKTNITGTFVSGNLNINTGVTATVSNGVTVNVGSLTLGGLGRSSGTWGGAGSGATNINTTFFNATSGKVNVTNDTRISPVVTNWPTAGAIAYGQALSNSTLSGGSAPAGTFTFATPAFTPTATGTYAASVIYTPTDTTAYNTSLTKTVNVTVNTKALTVTGVTASNKIYDRTFAATVDTNGAALVGVINSEDVSLSGTASGTFASSNAANGITVTISGLTLAGVNAGNYSLTQPTTTANITKKDISIAGGLTAVSRTYNGTTTATITSNNVTLTGVISGDTVNGRTNGYTATFSDKNVGTGKTVTVTNLTLGGTTATNNYNLLAASLSANITTTNITVTAATNTKVYDLTNTAAATPTVTSGSIQTGDSNGFTETYLQITVGSGNRTLVPAGVVNDGNGGSNYNVTFANFTTGTITAKPLTVSGVTASDKTYDRTFTATISTNGAALVGVISPDVVNLGGTATGTFASSNAASGITVTIAGLTISGANATNYSITQPTDTANITKKDISIAGGLTAISRAYNGTTTATITSNNVTLTGVISGDTVNGRTNGYTATFSDKNVGTGKTVTVTNLTLGGTVATNNYNLLAATLSANISNTSLTVTASGVNKSYDGTTAATVNLSTTAAGGDVVTASYTTATFADKNTGTNKTVSVSGISISDADAGNYTLGNTTTSTTANITRAVVVLTGSRTYDGTSVADVSNLSISNNFDGGNVSLTGSGSVASKNVGSSAISAGATPTRIQVATGTGNSTPTIPVTLGTAPVAGNTLIAFVSIHTNTLTGTGITNITQTGATWTRAGQSTTTGALTEIWYATNLTSASTSITFNYVANSTVNRGEAVVVEYSGLLAANPVDKTVTASGTSTAVASGSTATTSQSNELWVAGISFTNSGYALSSLTGGFTTITNIPGGSGTPSNNTVVYALEQTPGTTGTASVGGTLNTNSQWSALIVTFKASVPGTPLGLTGSAATNYTLTGASGNMTISAKALTVSGLTASSKIYDGNTTATLGGSATLQSAEAPGTGSTADGKPYTGDTVTLIGTPAGTFADAIVGVAKSVTVTGSTVTNTNYTVTQQTGLTADISQQTPVIATSPTATDINLGQALSDSSLSGGSVTNAAGASVSGTFAFTSPATTPGVGTANQSVTFTPADTTNYTTATGTASVTVVNTTQTITFGTLADKTYGDATFGISATASSGLEVTFAVQSGPATISDGTNVTVTGAGSVTIRASQAGDGSYTAAANVDRSFTVSAKSLTPSVAVDNKVYDGDTTASITNRALSGVINSDDVALTNGTATFDDKNVGTNKTVTTTGLTLTGAAASNYSLATTTVTNAAEISVRTLTVTVTGADKTYDGNTNATVTTDDNRVTNDVFIVTSTANFADKNIGTNKTVSVSDIAITGTDATNYTLASTTGSTTANITARTLTITASASNKTYDATNTASVTLTNDAVSGDDVVVGYTDATFADANIGTGKTVTVNGVNVTGADEGNYSYSTSVSATADITALALTPSVAVDNKVYDGDATASITNRSVSGAISGDDVSLTGGTASFDDKNVGAGKSVITTGLSLTGTASGNYSLTTTTVTNTAEITSRTLNVTASASNKTYDATNTASVTLTNDAVSGDDVIVSYTSATFADKTVGTNKTVTVSGLGKSGTDAGNYSLAATANTTANISARALTITASASNKTYDATNTASVTVTNDAISGDDVIVGYTDATFADANVGSGKTVTVNSVNVTGADAGNYSFSTSVSATADITARTVTANVTVSNKTYDANTDATITSRSLSNAVSGDDVSLIGGTASFATKDAGTNNTVNVTGLALDGAASGNYSLASSSVDTTANITSRALTITANDASKPYDGAAYTGGNGVTYVGFASGETNTDLIGSLAFGGTSQGATSAGSYTIVPSGYSSDNYAFSYVNGSLTISQVTLLVTADDASRLYDEANPTFTASYSGFVNGEGTEVLSGFVIVSTAATNGSDAGTYALEVDASFLTADNYSFATSNGVLTINPVSLTGAVTSSANPSPTGSNVTFTTTLAAVAPGSTTPSGTVQFYVDGSAFGAPATLSSGVATLTTNSLAHGSHTIGAAFLGNVNYYATSNSLAAQLINTAPTAGADTLATRENTPVNAAAFKLLLNDSDTDSDSISVTAVSAASAQGGTVALSGVTVTYTPPTNYSGADSFTYTVTDSFGGTNTGTVNVTVNPANGGPERVVSNDTLPDGNQHLVFAGIPGFSYVVQGTTNLSPAVWVNLSTNTAGGNGLFNYNDLNATNYSMRYYRSVSH